MFKTLWSALAATVFLTACGSEPTSQIDMELANAQASDWLKSEPNAGIAWMGMMRGMYTNSSSILGRIPKDICYTIWNGQTEGMPSETLTSTSESCDYFADRLVQTLQAYGFLVNNRDVIKSEYLRDFTRNYDSHEVSCVIGTLDKSKMPEWDTYAPTSGAVGGFTSCNGGSPYTIDQKYQKRSKLIEEKKRKGLRLMRFEKELPKSWTAQGLKESDFPIWKHGNGN